MKLVKFLTVVMALSVSGYSGYAEARVAACIKRHASSANCYELHITITDTDPELGIVYVASGDVWVGSNRPSKKKLKRIGQKRTCTNFLLNNEMFLTDAGSLCLQAILSNPVTYAKYKAARDKLLPARK